MEGAEDLRGRTNRTPEKDAKFFAKLAQGFSVTTAAAAAGWSRRTAYDHREADAEFRAAWDVAVEEGTDLFEDEMRRRACQGVEEPVFYQGEVCGAVKKYSDTLMIFQMKKRRPEYRDSVDLKHSGDIGLGGLLRALDKPGSED